MPALKPRQGRLLARLLLSPNTTVPIETLTEALWDGEAPDSAARQVQNAASQLRQAWLNAQVIDARAILRTAHSGYRLETGAGQIDLENFRESVAEGRRLELANDTAGAVGALRQGLALWRGPAFAGMRSRVIETYAAQINEQRVSTLQECIRLELAIGPAEHVIPELAALVAEYPYREQLTGLLMTAFYRMGRQTDALQAYQDQRARLDAELGIEPGPELRKLHQRILRSDATLLGSAGTAQPGRPVAVASPGPAVPAEMPPPLGYFVGHLREMALLHRDPEPGQVTVVTGAAGMGKTSLVAQWAAQARDMYPDGQIFLDLRGDDTTTRRAPSAVLGHILESLQPTLQQMPHSLDRQVSLFRTLVSSRRVLIVLDNADGIDQVLPSIPVGGGSRLIVTSRRRLAALHAHTAVRLVTVEPLSPEESIELLTVDAPARSADKLAPQVRELGALCGGMPLALRILAARLLSEPLLTPGDLLTELSGSDLRLDGFLLHGDARSVRSVLRSTYEALPELQQAVFRLLAVHPGRRFRLELVAAITGLPLPAARRIVGSLAAINFVTKTGPEHITLHDLVRHFAAETLDRTDPAARTEALHRLRDWYLSVAAKASRVLRPDRDAYEDRVPLPEDHLGEFRTVREAIDFLGGERESLASVTAATLEIDLEATVELIYYLHSYYVRSGFPTAAVGVWRSCADRSEEIKDELTRAHLHHALGGACAVIQELAEGVVHMRRSAELYEAANNLGGAAGARLGIGWALEAEGRLADALAETERAKDLALAAGNTTLVVHALFNSAETLAVMGEFGAALTRLQHARRLAGETDERQLDALITSSIGELYVNIGSVGVGLGYLHEARQALHALGYRKGEARALMRIGVALRRSADANADKWLRQSLALFSQSNDPAGVVAVTELLEGAARSGDAA
ncbi:AfsR/SARP family transcriptional regulator [Mangrovihabitans endophyticus]|uniref:AfsR/SARP family transcriptional regulator n=1 Tax=Mangrovihabitans endophyticus TaxID=1751298 RepID=UPI0016682FE2|nr:BTAD domain-containing putative transcriptional regulator [Mangrovihabitans endophyticus]